MHPCSEFILGGQRSGKSRCGEQRAARWLAAHPSHRATLLATAEGGDDEMRERIARHQQDRRERVPALTAEEVGLDLAGAVRRLGAPDTLLLVDCLTLWLTRWLMPMEGSSAGSEGWPVALDHLVSALKASPSPVVLVSNEIGMGLAPLSREARRYVDELGRLHQQVAAVCPNATLMVAGLEMPLKRVAAGGWS